MGQAALLSFESLVWMMNASALLQERLSQRILVCFGC